MGGGDSLATLFDQGGVVVLDDIPVEVDVPEGSPGLPVRHAFSQVIGLLGHYLSRSRRGTVVLLVLSFFERTHIDAFCEGVRAVLKTDVKEVRVAARPRIAALRDLSPAEQSAIRVLAFLRFAEPLHILDGIVQTGPGARLIEVLRGLKEKGWVVEIGGRYALRHEIAARRLAVDLGAVDECRGSLLAVGRHFEALANDAETLEPLHYALEAERAYFAASAFFGAELWADGMRALGLAAGDLTDRDAGTDAFLVETLTGYYEHLGPRLFEGLPVRTLARWDQAFFRVRLPVTRSLRSLLLAPMAAANPLVRDWFVARSNLARSGYRQFEAAKPLFAIRDALRARTRGGRRDTGDLQLLADVHLDLGWAYQQSYLARRDAGQWRRWLRHAQLAERCYRAVDDSRGLADAGKMIGLAYLNHGRPAQALSVLLPLARRTAQMPGFASLKASILVSTFGALLATGRRTRAEGYFHEASYQYSASGKLQVIDPLVTLAAGLMFPARAERLDPLLAAPLVQVQRKVSAIWSTFTIEARAENLQQFGAFLAECVRYLRPSRGRRHRAVVVRPAPGRLRRSVRPWCGLRGRRGARMACPRYRPPGGGRASGTLASRRHGPLPPAPSDPCGARVTASGLERRRWAAHALTCANSGAVAHRGSLEPGPGSNPACSFARTSRQRLGFTVKRTHGQQTPYSSRA